MRAGQEPGRVLGSLQGSCPAPRRNLEGRLSRRLSIEGVGEGLGDRMAFRQVIPDVPGRVREGRPTAGFVEAAGRIGYDAFAAALKDVRLLEAAFDLPEPEDPPPHGLPAAAVLLPVVGGRSAEEEAKLVVIRRAAHLRSNPGELAFAGGHLEPGESALDAALRETTEEVFLEPRHVRVLGELSEVIRRTRDESIQPFVATVDGAPRIEGNPAEVDEVLFLPLARLADPGRYFEEVWPMPGGDLRTMHFFDLGEDVMWGASAHMLVLLLDKLAAVAAAGAGESEGRGDG